MAVKPPIPDGFVIPETVNGWEHDPDSNKNGHTWYSPNGAQSVVVYSHLGRVYANVADERTTGSASSETVAERKLTDKTKFTSAESRSVVAVLDDALGWMRNHAPGSWTCPRVNEAVFDPPAGYDLAEYFLASRESTIYYRHCGMENIQIEDGDELPGSPSFLVIHCWTSGNATVAVAPWLRAHDHEMMEVVETPEECGLDVALAMSRQWVADHVGHEESKTVGQTSLQQFAEAE